ncbi:MAG: SpoIIE family protein phosphatase [Planctomycetota bacterium]
MPRKRAAVSAPEPSESRITIQRPTTRGPGIALKFALPVSIVVSLVVGLLGWSVYTQTEAALDASINSAGVFAATAMAAPDWHNEDNANRLKELLDDRTIEVAVFEKDDQGRPYIVATATGAKTIEVRERREVAKIGEVTVDRGRMSVGERVDVPFRSFLAAIRRPEGGPRAIASVRVYLSEQAIEDELGSLLRKIIVFSLLGIGVGIAVSFVVARMITRPIGTLVQDLRAVAGGNLAHRTRVRSRDEIGALAHAFDEMTRGLEEGRRLEQDLLSKEHQEQITQEIQERLFPRELPAIPGIEVDAAFEPAGDISSDLFDFIEVDDRRTGFLLLSASGRGVPAAMVLAMARSVFRAVAPGVADPAAAMKRINAQLSPDLRRGMYVTALYAIYDRAERTLKLVSAGHKLGVFHLAAASGEFGTLHPAGIAMGLDKGPVFDRSLDGAQVVLEPGDGVLMGTAGLLALRLENGEALGEARFAANARKALQEGGDEIARRLASRIGAHLAADPGEQDLTLVSLAVAR